MSVPIGSFGIGVFSYDLGASIYDKACAINVAPLERIGVSVSMEKATYNDSAAGVYGYPGQWDDNFVGILTYISDMDLQVGDADTIASGASVLPAENINDDGSVVTGQLITMIPEEWAGSTRTIHFIFQFTHNKSGSIETDYAVIPVRLTIRDFEDGTGSGLIQLISVVDNGANDVSKGVCVGSLPETVTFTFQYNGASPETFLFIPTIKSEFSDYKEHNAWANANMPQLTNDLVVSADQDFTGGTAELVLDGAKLLSGSYCIGAIAKQATPATPTACVTTIDVALTALFKNWTTESFTVELTYGVTAPVGFTVERVQVGLYFEDAGSAFPPGLIFQIVEDGVISVNDESSYPDNISGTRPDGGQYRFRALGLIRLIEDATGQICSYNNFFQEFFINTPSSSDVLVTYQDSYSHTIVGLAVGDTGKQN